MLQIENITYARSGKILFKNLNLNIQSQQVLQILGANGSGKSSLLKILAGFIPPLSGNIYWYEDQNINQNIFYNSNYHHKLAYLGHLLGLKNYLTVDQHLDLLIKLYEPKNNFDLLELLNYFNLAKHRNKFCDQLSAGQRQKLALLGVKIIDRPIWLLDEPLANLDKSGYLLVEELISTQAKKGGIVIFTTHHPIQISNSKFFMIELG